MDLDIEMFRTRGRAAVPLAAEIVRDLERADMELLTQEKGSVAPPLKRISDRHHALARNLAAGMSDTEAGLICGYTSSRISILKADPAFKNLMEFYREGVEEVYRDLHEQLSGLAKDAAAEIAMRLEEEPEKVSMGQLMELTKMGADRTGHGPQTSNTNLNVNVDMAVRLEAARRRVQDRLTESNQ
jgi:hypothetical protein